MRQTIYEWINTLTPIKQVIISYAKWLIITTILAFSAYLLAKWSNTHYHSTVKSVRIYQTISTIFMATALGKKGYNIQTWGGETIAEKWNNWLFLIFSALGYLILIYSLFLEP